MNDEDLLAVIKMAAMEAVQASKPADVVYGDIVSSNPLQVKMDQKLTLSQDFLVVPNELKENLKKGKKVILIQKAGGQRYVVIGTL